MDKLRALFIILLFILVFGMFAMKAFTDPTLYTYEITKLDGETVVVKYERCYAEEQNSFEKDGFLVHCAGNGGYDVMAIELKELPNGE